MFDSDLENENTQENAQENANTQENAGNPAINWTTPTPIVAESRSSQPQTAENPAEAVGTGSGAAFTGSVEEGTAANGAASTAGTEESVTAGSSTTAGTAFTGSTQDGTAAGNPVNGTASAAGVTEAAGSSAVFSGSVPVQPSRTDNGSKAEKGKKQKTKKEKKPAGIVKRAFVAALCGLLFGAAAAGSFYGVYQLAGGPEIVASIVDASQNNTTTVVVSNTDLVISDDTDETDESAESSQSTWITEVADAVMPSMVSVTNNYTETGSYFGYSYSQAAVSVGSGIIIGSNDDELLIVTNEHVIEDYDSLSVTFVDGSEVTAYLKGSDADMDVAVMAVLYEDIEASTLEQIRIAVLGDSDELVLGQYVVAIGNALGYGQSVTDGIVTALNREVETESGSTGYFIQTNAAVNPGNSGGALLDSAGRVIGIVSAKIGGDTVEGMGFAIPINSAVDIINDLSTNTTMIKLSDDEKGYLGVTVLSDSYNTQTQREMYGIPDGAYVRSVEEDGGAYNAGIQAGDVITAIDGNTVTGYDDLASILQYYSADTDVTVTFQRSLSGVWTEMEVTVTLGTYPTSE
ncbi:MAG: trypsin-like peptidase domain-containing protein [Lachnospiraceae bacterium]|nr:trypsin-like peptidase domain-containing protein [Lachnospiraceae bacterium]